MMNKFLIVVSAFCLCFSLVAAEGEAEPEKRHWPNWKPKNLAIGPFMMTTGIVGSMILPLVFVKMSDSVGEGIKVMLWTPVWGMGYMIDGAVHTATFGLLYSYDEKTHEEYDYVAMLFDRPFDRFRRLTKRKEKKSEGPSAFDE